MVQSDIVGVMNAARRAASRMVGYLHCRLDPWARVSWSQEGEDLILARLLEGVSSGFFVDVGAHHPFRFSNTAYFSERGWTGINVEPDPFGAELISRFRPRDVTLNVGVGTIVGSLMYYRFDEPALNTFDGAFAQERERTTKYRISERVDVSVARLDTILTEHVPIGRRIDFLNVDAEGRDEDVLRSNDWQRFRPTITVVEILEAATADVTAIASSSIGRFMRDVAYRPAAKTFNSVFFVDQNSMTTEGP
jgi:FkbM family methyltransferase